MLDATTVSINRFEEVEREQVRISCGQYLGDPYRFDDVRFVSNQQQINDAEVVFRRSGGHVVAWPSLVGPEASGQFTEQARKIINDQICGRSLVLPGCFQAPLEGTVRLMLADHREDPQRVVDLIHRRVDDIEADYYPLFQVTMQGRRTLYVIRVNERLMAQEQ